MAEKFLTDAEVATLGTAAPSGQKFLTDEEVAARGSGAPQQAYEAGLARTLFGQGALLGWGDEIMGRLRQVFAGEDYEKARDDERAKVAAFKAENPKTALAAELGGGFLTPGLGLVAGVMKPAATVGKTMWQGAKLGAGVGALAGAGAADEDTLGGAKHGALVGGVLGGTLSGVGSVAGNALTKTIDAAAPTLARVGAKISRQNPDEAAADSVLKSWLRSSGDDPKKLRSFFNEADRVSRLDSNSYVDVPLTLADASSGMQKLAGGVVRGNPEAAKVGEAVLGARQTGVTPKGDAAAIASRAGIAHRNPLAVRKPDQEAAGMYERVGEYLKRAFTIFDKDHHKFGDTAYQTEKAMLSKLKERSNELYGEARKLAHGVDVGQTIEPIITQTLQATANMQTTEAAIIKRALRLFTTGDGKLVSDLHGFDQAKKALDSLIAKTRNPTQPDRYAEKILTDLKNTLLNAVDGIKTNGVGAKYKEARNYFSSGMEMKDALDLGRKAWREDSNVAADQIAELTEGQQKLFRLGLHDAYMGNKGNTARSADVTRVFETPRMQQILEAAVPRSDKSTAVFADRPERLGELVSLEKLMSNTKNKVFGNSMTAERLADDARLGRATIGEMFDRYRSSPTLLSIGMEIVSTGLNKMFGFKDEVARELARRLFTADRAQRDAILARIEQTWGSDRVATLGKFMAAANEATAAAIPGQTGLMIGQNKK